MLFVSTSNLELTYERISKKISVPTDEGLSNDLGLALTEDEKRIRYIYKV